MELNDEMQEIGAGIVLVCDKSFRSYTQHIVDSMIGSGIRVVYLMARGTRWVGKAQLIVEHVVNELPTVSVYAKDEGVDEYMERQVPVILFTLLAVEGSRAPLPSDPGTLAAVEQHVDSDDDNGIIAETLP